MVTCNEIPDLLPGDVYVVLQTIFFHHNTCRAIANAAAIMGHKQMSSHINRSGIELPLPLYTHPGKSHDSSPGGVIQGGIAILVPIDHLAIPQRSAPPISGVIPAYVLTKPCNLFPFKMRESFKPVVELL